MTAFAEVVDPFDLTAREWVIGLEPSAIHSIARLRLYIRGLPSGSYFPAGGLPGPPPGTTSERTLGQLSQRLESQPVEQLRPPPMVRPGSFLFDVLGNFVETHGADGVYLAEGLRLLEGLTLTLALKSKSKKKLAKKARTIPFADVVLTLGPGLKHSRRQWGAQLLKGRPRDCRLLEDDEVLKRELAQVKSTGQGFSFALRARVDHNGRLRLGSWSCQLPKPEWDRLWHNPRWQSPYPSEWAEELLAAKMHATTRDIKEQLAGERTERKIEAAWATYGRWLSEHRRALRDIELLLGDLPIRIPTDPVTG
jgi:hypothetical protein